MSSFKTSWWKWLQTLPFNRKKNQIVRGPKGYFTLFSSFFDFVFSSSFCKTLIFTPPVGLVADVLIQDFMVEMAATIIRAEARISMSGTSIIFSCRCWTNSVVRRQPERPPYFIHQKPTNRSLSYGSPFCVLFLSRCSNDIEQLS